jgi:hypothetical protein
LTPIDFVRVDADILLRLDLSSTEKLTLGLIKNFNSKGLMMSNASIGELIGTVGDSVTRIIKTLKLKNLIKIKNPQSRYRKIFYSGADADIESNSTPTYKLATPTSMSVYSGADVGQNRSNRKNRSAHTPKLTTFVIPTPVEVTDYASSIFYKLDAQHFCDYYSSKGWLIGSAPMQDWRAAVRNWKCRDDKRQAESEEVAAAGLPAPDTDAILTALGRTPEQIAKFKAEGNSL